MNGGNHCTKCNKPTGCKVGECNECKDSRLEGMRSTFTSGEMRFGGRWDCPYCGFSCPAEMGGTQSSHLELEHKIIPKAPTPAVTPEQLVERYREALKSLLDLGWIAGETWGDYLNRHDSIIHEALALDAVNKDNSERPL